MNFECSSKIPLHTLAIGIGLEYGDCAKGVDLAMRLTWLTSLEFAFTSECQDIVLLNEFAVANRHHSKKYWLVTDCKTRRQYTQDHIDTTYAKFLQPIPRITFHLHWCIDDALCERKDNEHIFAIDWAKWDKQDEKEIVATKRYIATANIERLLEILRERPDCDQTLYTISLAGYAATGVQFDLEACLSLNPHLRSIQIQYYYVDTLRRLFQEFLGVEHELPYLDTYGSDDKKFSSHLQIQYPMPDTYSRDNLVKGFYAWLWNKKDQEDVASLLICHKFTKKKKKGEIKEKFHAIMFAIDVKADGRNRQMRAPFMTKKSERRLIPRNLKQWNNDALDALKFVLPNDLSRVSSSSSSSDPKHIIYVLKDGKEQYKHAESINRPPPEDTYLYRFKEIYKLIKPYKVKEPKGACNLMWKQDTIVTRFNVPPDKYDLVLQWQAKTHFSLLHECFDTQPNAPRKANFDCDGTSLSPDVVAIEYAMFNKSRVAVKQGPQNPKDPEGIHRFHLVCVDLSFANHESNCVNRWKFHLMMLQKFGKDNWPDKLDRPHNLRMLGSTKDERVLGWYGAYDQHGEQIQVTDPLQRQQCCSLVAVGMNIVSASADDLEAYNKQQHKNRKESSHNIKDALPYNPNDPQHCFMASELQHIYNQCYNGAPVKITGIVVATNGCFTVYLDSKHCRILATLIQNKEKNMHGRNSPYEHISQKVFYMFTPNGIYDFCFDSDCKKVRATTTRHCFPYTVEPDVLLFPSSSFKPISFQQQDLLYLARIYCPQDLRVRGQLEFPNGVQIIYRPEIRAYQVAPNQPFLDVPAECYCTEPGYQYTLFHECRPPGAIVIVDFNCHQFPESPVTFRTADGNRHIIHDPPHKAFHQHRVQTNFPNIRDVMFGQVKYLWEFPLKQTNKRYTWFVCSGKGTGKTVQNKRITGNDYNPKPYINESGYLCWRTTTNKPRGAKAKEAKVLVLSPLRSVASYYAQSNVYDCVNYMNIDSLANVSRLVCSLESLHKLPLDYSPHILILDEIEWLLQLFSGSTMKYRQESWIRFKSIVQRAQLVVASDARLGEKSYNILHACRSDAHERLYYNYHRENENHYVLHQHTSSWFKQLDDIISKRDEPTFIATNSKNQAILFHQHITSKCGDDDVLLITADTYNDLQNAVDNCETEWPKYIFVIITPVVGPAIDFSIPYFVHCLAWATPLSNTAAQFFQMIGRVRVLDSDQPTVHYFVDRATDTQQHAPLTREQIRKTLLDSLKDTAKLGIAFEKTIWNPLLQQYECRAYDQLFLELHVSNRFEEAQSRRNFKSEFAQLILCQQGTAPQVFAHSDPKLEIIIRKMRKENSARRKEREWELFDQAPNIESAAQAIQIKAEIDKGDNTNHQAYWKFCFREFYKIDEITKEQFLEDTPEKRKRIRLHETILQLPQTSMLLERRDQLPVTKVLSQRQTITDLNVHALPHEMHKHVLLIFGFPVDSSLVQCLHDTTLMRITKSYCERTHALLQIQHFVDNHQLYHTKDESHYLNEETAFKILRKMLKQSYDVALVSCPPLQPKTKKKRNPSSYALEVSNTSTILQRNPDLSLPKPIQSIQRAMPPNLFPVDIAYVLAFSPHQIPAYTQCTANVKPVQIGKTNSVSVSQFPKKCKTYCSSGILLRLQHIDLYYQDSQFWVFTEEHYIQVENAQAAIQYVPSNTNEKGTLWTLPEYPIFSLPNGQQITPAQWANRFATIPRPPTNVVLSKENLNK